MDDGWPFLPPSQPSFPLVRLLMLLLRLHPFLDPLTLAPIHPDPILFILHPSRALIHDHRRHSQQHSFLPRVAGTTLLENFAKVRLDDYYSETLDSRVKS